MKNNILFASAVFLLIAPMCIYASTPTFTSEAEIDVYYDAQKIQNKEKYEQKVQGIKNQLEIDIDNLHKEIEVEKLEAQRKIFGENFEIIKPFLPESNPDPEVIYLDLLKNPTQKGVDRIKILMLYNPELSEKVRLISKSKSDIAKLRLIEINKEICISSYGSKSEWNGVNNKNGEVYCKCSSGYVMGKDEKCVKDTTLNNIVLEKNEIINNPEVVKSNNIVSNPEQVIKIRWYQKIFKWFKK